MRSNIQKIADMHCHIVPGVDDGARTLEESMAILKEEYEQGVRLIIATPHWRRGMFETDRRTVHDHFCILKRTAEETFSDLQLYLGCEFHVNADMIDEINTDGLFRMNGSDYVLTEFSAHHDRDFVRNVINRELSSGYTPIIAHVERYPACLEKIDFISEIRQMGAFIQVNADSVIGRDGIRLKHAVVKLIKEQMVDFIGSDVHNLSDRSCHLMECEKILLKKFDLRTVKRMMWDNVNDMIRKSQDTEKISNDHTVESEEKVKHKPVRIRMDL